MEPIIKQGATYTFREDTEFPLDHKEFSTLFSFFEGLMNNPQFLDSTFRVRDIMNIMYLHKIVLNKLEQAIVTGQATTE